MFGRKQKKILALEAAISDTLANLIHVTIEFPEPVKKQFKAMHLRKGVWHVATIRFMVDDTEARFGRVFVGEDGGPAPYFDGETAPPSPGQNWREAWT